MGDEYPPAGQQHFRVACGGMLARFIYKRRAVTLPIVQVIYLYRFALIQNDPLQLALFVLQHLLTCVRVVPCQHLYHFAVFQLTHTGWVAILPIQVEIQCAVALAAIPIKILTCGIAVEFFHFAGGSIKKVILIL